MYRMTISSDFWPVWPMIVLAESPLSQLQSQSQPAASDQKLTLLHQYLLSRWPQFSESAPRTDRTGRNLQQLRRVGWCAEKLALNLSLTVQARTARPLLDTVHRISPKGQTLYAPLLLGRSSTYEWPIRFHGHAALCLRQSVLRSTEGLEFK